MPRKTPIFYFVLIGIPALLLTLAAVRLLMGVREQLVALEQERTRNVAEKVSGELLDWIHGLQKDILRQVEMLPRADLPLELRQFQRESPFVRNVFIWEKGKGVIFPVASQTENEEQRFLVRYAPLFKGDYAWQENRAEQGSPSQSNAKIKLLQTITRQGQSTSAASGWIPWFEGSSLFMLGWREDAPGRIVGAELEMSAVLARLQPVLEPWTYGRRGGQGIALMNGREVLLSAGLASEVGENKSGSKKSTPFELSLAPTLPHWALRITPATGDEVVGERTVTLIGGIILVLLVLSLFTGGFLLARDASRQHREAFQKTSFVSNVSHELKTPLTSIRMYAELLADGKAATTEVMKQYLHVIVTESERLTRLVNNVLDFGRLEQKRRMYHYETMNLSDVVSSVVEPLRGIAESAEMTLEVKTEAAVRVRADRDALNQVIVNLVDNACKYASEGKELEVTVGRKGEQAFVAVSDRGPGIAKAHARRIFERFYRADDSVTAMVGGSGLGLSIAKQLMQGMGGDVQWSAREGGGSIFTGTLPLEEES